MEQFAEDLRREREARGVSLEQISEATKIARRHLLALESGDLQALPGGIFRKGILRSYLSVLSVDPAPWLQQLELCLEQQGQAALPAVDLLQLAEQRSRAEIVAEPAPAARWPGVFAMLALLLVFGWCVWRFALRGHVLLSVASGAPAGHLRSAGLPVSAAIRRSGA